MRTKYDRKKRLKEDELKKIYKLIKIKNSN
jgi:hypothetical protein